MARDYSFLDDDQGNPSDLPTDDPIVKEARRRFDRCNEWEGEWRQRAIKDKRFAYGDSENGFQWPNEIRNAREKASRPCLTMNLIRAHNKLISNEMRRNKSEVRFIGMGNGATQDSANVMQDLFRHTQYISDAQHLAFPTARQEAVDIGIGYFRLVTRYEADDSFDVDVYIEPVDDPMMVFLDPDIHPGGNGLDAKYGFIFDDVPKDEFREAYPDIWEQVKTGREPLGLGTERGDWTAKEHVRLVEYFRRVPEKKELISFVHLGERFTLPRDRLNGIIKERETRDRIIDNPQTRIREVTSDRVEWFLIVGLEVIDETVWPGKYIPIQRVVGEEIVIDGRLDRKGHTRYMLDAQRMFNYFSSAQIEGLSLQTRAPWLAPAKAIEEHEAVWRYANIDTPAVLPYNHVDPEGSPEVPIPPPQRIEPPAASPGFQQAIENSRQQIMMVSGQYLNELGEQGNERTGAAIKARTSQAATANYHFQDNYEQALIALGKQLLDLYPKIYDTRRVRRVVASDGLEYDLVMDPSLRGVYAQEQNAQGEVIKRVLNPLIGKYDVAAAVGPSFDTRRDETREDMTLILTQAPALIPLVGDILLKSMNFEGATEAALRMRRMIPPVALGTGPTPNEQMLQQQVQAMQQQLVKALDLQAKSRLKLDDKESLREVEVYNAETKRIAALSQLLPMDPQALKALIEQTARDALGESLGELKGTVESEEKGEGGGEAPASGSPSGSASLAPPPGSQQAPDGQWYLRDPTRKGKYLLVAPLAQERRGPR